jgi:hypothetical protein
MGKVLIRSGMTPYEPYTMDEILLKNLIGYNSGNLIYQYGVYRALMMEDTKFVSSFFGKENWSDEQIDRINAECQYVILPMANSFRMKYGIKKYTAFIKRMKIPCVVIGIGLQAPDSSKIEDGFPFDGDARDFVRAALDHSALIGLRGENTARYLKHLGFLEGRHYTVIGCPSMFAFGGELPKVRVGALTAASCISVNGSPSGDRQRNLWLRDVLREYEDHYYVFQQLSELELIRYGTPLYTASRAGRDGNSFYPRTGLHPDVRNGRAIGFVSARAWLQFMAGVDFSFGARIHGNLAAVLSGTPALVLTTDTRTEELSAYFDVPHIPATDIQPGTDLRALYDKCDFDAPRRGHMARFQHYMDFLNANSLPHIWRDTLTSGETSFDRAMAALPETGTVVRKGPLSMSQRATGMKLLAGGITRVFKRKLKA